ncbi:hypothetical protein BKA63DRAFT_563170 [Paraphoma chrysanthemicola]|nr:hypothetical protein BKA63DRAFT_563170 [Paraphoma chrysanthemicola]
MIARKLRKKRERKDKWRADTTATWYARLQDARSFDDTNAVGTAGPRDVSPQSESPFFSKLPLEIRRLVYWEFFASNELLFQVVNEIKAERRPEQSVDEKSPFELRCRAAQGLLSFPFSCKLAYMESIQYLYTSSTFRLAGITEYWCLTRLVSRQYLDLIRYLHVQYSYTGTGNDHDLTLGTPPYNLHCWKETWNDVSRLKGLERVRIDIYRYEMSVFATDEELYFSSLDELRCRVELEVYVSWRPEPGVEIWPFMLRRGMIMRRKSDDNFSLEAP